MPTATSFRARRDDDSGEGRNGRLTFTASESGTYYIAAVAYSSRQGTYELEVTDTAADDVRDGAKDLGDITGLDGPRFPNASLDGDGDRVDYFRFTLTEAKEVGLGLRQQDADADLFLEDAEGNVLHSSTVDGTANEAINETLLAGTYYVRVEAQEAGDNDFKLRYGVSAPDAAAVTALEQQGQGGTNEAPAFAETSYAFDLAENADGGTTRVALGTVSATDPEAAALTYSIEGGNAAGLFEIDGSTGALSYRGTGEDYESATTGYELTVRASDGGLHSDVTVTVNVTDVEETVPEPMTSVSEPDGGDLPSDATTTGRVAVGETATGEIGHADDRDWFAVDLVAEHTYDIDLRGIGTYSDSLRLPYLRGIHDAEGNLISDDSRGLVDLTGFSSQLTFTASESGTYYIAAGGFESRQGTYELEVTDTADDDTRDGATDLGDITGWWSPRPTNVFLDGDGDQLDYFRFTLKKMKKVHIAVPLEDADADLYLEDAEGNVLYSSTEGGPANELIGETLQAGTYYVRVQAQEAGDNEFTMSWMAGTPDAWAVLGKPRPQLPEDTLPDDTSTTGRLAVGGTVKGNIESSGDRDWFEVDLVAGQSYVIDLRGRPTGDGTLYDPYLRGVHDAGGNLIADTWQDDGGTGDNSRLTFTASESGTYYIAAGADWGGRGTYELEVTDPDAPDLPENTSTAGRVVVGGSVNNEIEHANDVDWFAVELVAGRAYTIDLRGSPTWFHVNLLEDTVGTSDDHGPLRDPRLRGIYDADGHLISGTTDPDDGGLGSNGRLGEGYTSQLTFTASENGTHYIAAGGQTSGTGAYEVTVWQDDFAATRETTGTIEVVGSAGSTTGEIESAYDRDWFAVELTAGETYKFELLGSHSRGGTVFQPYIHGIHDANGRLVADTTDYSSGPRGDSEVLFTPSQSGTYYVSAGQSQPTYVFAHTGTYTLQVSIDDFSDDSDTAGTVEVGGSVTGEIEAQGDRDWFAVTLEAGKSYEIDMEGSATDGGTLANPLLGGMHDSDGDQIGLTWDHDSGEGLNSRVTFTPDEGGTFYVVAGSGGGQGSADFAGRSLGTYTLSVEEVVDAI